MSDEHPSDATVAAFLDGILEAPDRVKVLAHVDTCEACRLLLADAVVAATGKIEQHDEIGLGTLLGGRYRIERVLGRGGFGAVYLAKDEKLGRAVALKVLVATEEDSRLRFEREARVLAELDHPNVVRVLDFGDENGLPFLVLEHLTGETLAQRLGRGGPLPATRAVRLILEVLSALSAAHERGVIHRDLKPANVFLVLKGSEPSVRVLDFGVAKLVQRGDRLRTETGTMLGTPAYMAPEQLLAAPVDARTDVHAAGALLFEMLTGRRAFLGDRIELVTSILVEDRPRVDALRKDVPPAIVAVVEKALARRPENRFQDAASMATALEDAMRTGAPSLGAQRVFAIGSLSAIAVGLLGGAFVIHRASTRTTTTEVAPRDDAATVISDPDPVDSSDPEPVAPLPRVEDVESGAPRANCVCVYAIRDRLFGAPLCPTTQTPRCSCEASNGAPLCKSVRHSEDTTCKGGYKTFVGQTLKSGDACKGYAFVWRNGQQNPGEAILTDGTLTCEVCYKPVYVPGTHRAPCRGLDHVGRMTDGQFLCR